MSYTYSISGDFPSGKVSSDRLQTEIQASSITVALDSIGTSGDDCVVSFKASLSPTEETTLDGLVAAHSGVPVLFSSQVELVTPSGSPLSTDSVGRLRTSSEKSYLSKKTIFSHDWTDKTTWYPNSVYVESEVATNSGDDTTYNLANQYLIDNYHGKLSGERNLLDGSNRGYRVNVYINDVLKTEQDPHLGSGGDYTINYAAGSITFLSANSGSDVIKCDYHYATDSVFSLIPDSGKSLQIMAAEVQFSTDIEITDSVIFQPFGLVDVFAPQLVGTGEGQIPSGTKIPIDNPLVYQTIRDYQNDSVRAYATYPPIGGNSWRGCTQPVAVFDWDYVSSTPIHNQYGMEIRVWLEHGIPLGGTFATVTFYCNIE